MIFSSSGKSPAEAFGDGLSVIAGLQYRALNTELHLKADAIAEEKGIEEYIADEILPEEAVKALERAKIIWAVAAWIENESVDKTIEPYVRGVRDGNPELANEIMFRMNSTISMKLPINADAIRREIIEEQKAALEERAAQVAPQGGGAGEDIVRVPVM